MYIKLNSIQPRLEEWIQKSWKAGKWNPNVVINTDGEIIDSRLKVPITGDVCEDQEMKDKVLYVWFDAPIGYPSITADYTSQWRQWWLNNANVKLYQFLRKDIVYFHTVFWPSIQLGDGREWTMLHHISATEFLNYEGGKFIFSKSQGRGVFGPAAKALGISASVWRYYHLSTRPETSKSMFSWTEFICANNAVLLNNSQVPDGSDTPGALSPQDEQDSAFITEVNSLLTAYLEAMDSVKLRLGLQTVMLMSARGNLYLQQSGLGNALFNDDPKRCAQVVSRAINLIYILFAVVYPFMPTTSEAILAQLNAPARTIPDALSNDILPRHKIGTPAHLFKRIDAKQADIWRQKFGGVAPAPEQFGAPLGAANGTTNLSKRKAAATSKVASRVARPKEGEVESDSILELEAQIKAQGDHVRALKEKEKKRDLLVDGELSHALGELFKLKSALKDEQANK